MAKNYKLVSCDKCGLIFTDPRSDSEDRKKIQASIYASDDYHNQYLRDKNGLEKRFRKRIKEIERYKPKGRVLDIGCSYGFFLKVAKEEGWDVCGIEINMRAAEYAKDRFGLNIHCGDLSEVELPIQFFDVVTMWDVLEHIPDPCYALHIVKRVLKEGGLLGVQCPNIRSFTARIKKDHWDWLTPEDHLYHFSPETLKYLLKKTGFEVLYLKTWEPSWHLIDCLLGVGGGNLLSSLYNKFMLGIIRKFFFFLFWPIQWLNMITKQGGLIVAYARKK